MALLSDYYCDSTGNDTTGDGTSGTPFATLQKCFDTIDTEASSNLVTAASGVVTCHLVGSGSCGTNELLSGITVNATNYIRILGATHATKVQWDTSSAYLNASAANGLDIQVDYTLVDNVQVVMTDTAATIGIKAVGNQIEFDSCIVRGVDPSTTGNRLKGFLLDIVTTETVTVRNSLVYGIFTSTGGTYSRDFEASGAGTINFYNCMALEDPTLSFAYGFMTASSPTLVVTNCYSSGIVNYGSVTTLTTSAANDTEGTSANLDNLTMTTTNFVDPLNATTTSRDFTLVSGTKLEDGTESTDLSGTFTTDWFGNTISSWPIGVAELVSAGGSTGKSNPLNGPLGGPLAGVM